MAVVRLSSMPKPHTVRTFRFPTLDGGLNLRDAEINLNGNESSESVNMWFEDGVLQSRPGAVVETESPSSGDIRDNVYAAIDFEGGAVAHIVSDRYSNFYVWNKRKHALKLVPLPSYNMANTPGTFFRFNGDLYYKNSGTFLRLSYAMQEPEDAEGDEPPDYAFQVSDVADGAFVPTVLINANPVTGSGDLYQPENRLSPKKRVTYNAVTTPETVTRIANGTNRIFSLGVTKEEHLSGVQSVYIDDAYCEPARYYLDLYSGTVTFLDAAPANGATLTFELEIGNREYHLPVQNIDSVTEVILWSRGEAIALRERRAQLSGGGEEEPGDGDAEEAGDSEESENNGDAGEGNGEDNGDGDNAESWDYEVNLAEGIVTFRTAPPVTDPPTNNTVEIVYNKANPEAKDAVMNCPYAAVCGTGRDLCVIVGGGENQTNAVFWSGSTQTGLDISYWPVNQNNFTDGEITGFARQYDQMFVFQRSQIGKLSVSTEEVNGRNVLSVTYSGVNDKIGCDLPQSVRLIENNLTFANTSGGVYQILSASAAYENNVQCVSDKINGSNVRPGLLYDMRVAGAGTVCSLDDGKRYWLAVNRHIWIWDYSVSSADNPSWFYFTGLSPQAFSYQDGEICFFDAEARGVRLSGNAFSDYGETPIRKAYQFPVQNFGSYDRLKDVRTVIFSTVADLPSNTDVVYETDYETRTDPVKLRTSGNDRLTERDLTVRDLNVPRSIAVFRRAPGCRHVRHFSVRLENDEAGYGLSVFSAEIQYRFAGRDR